MSTNCKACQERFEQGLSAQCPEHENLLKKYKEAQRDVLQGELNLIERKRKHLVELGFFDK